MATLTRPPYEHERRVAERRRGMPAAAYPALPSRADGMKVSWGGVFGGVFVAIGLLLLLAALGVAVGISSVDPGATEAASLGTAAGWWAALSLLAALFLGGWASTRIAAISDSATGFFEGALVWVVSVLLIVYFASSGVGMLAGGAFRLVGGATQAISSAVQGVSGNIDLSAGAPQIVEQLQDPQTVRTVAGATGLPQEQVRSTLDSIAQRVEAVQENPAQVAAAVREGLAELYRQANAAGTLEKAAEEIQPGATRAAWYTFFALLLSLIAAVIGALVGRRRLAHHPARQP